MPRSANDTHDPNLVSWVSSANQEGHEFPIQNLPFACVRDADNSEQTFVGVAIGDEILNLSKLFHENLFTGSDQELLSHCRDKNLDGLMALNADAWKTLRALLSDLLKDGNDKADKVKACFLPQKNACFELPCTIGDYTDFYTSIYHATAVGKLFRPDNPLLPNYKWVPIGYHGRASSIKMSGTDFHRPRGQLKTPDMEAPEYLPCRRLDYEVEMGIFVGTGNSLGSAVPIDDAEDYIFGLCLLNDWSARDIQAWEYQPLGPFLAKSFLTALSPWIVTNEALIPFRSAFDRPATDPHPLAYLTSEDNSLAGGYDIQLDCFLQPAQSKEKFKLSSSNFKYSYWTAAQMLTHHSANGCNLQPGDLLGSGTQSGPNPEEAGSLIELTQGGKTPLQLSDSIQRTFLEDGDCIEMRGHCSKNGFRSIGFGTMINTVLPAQ